MDLWFMTQIITLQWSKVLINSVINSGIFFDWLSFGKIMLLYENKMKNYNFEKNAGKERNRMKIYYLPSLSMNIRKYLNIFVLIRKSLFKLMEL